MVVDTVVSPINKNEGPGHQSPGDKTVPGLIFQLLGGDATPQVATNLPALLRQILKGRLIQSSTINDFLQRNPSIKRYESAFKLLWCLLIKGKIRPEEATADEIADAIIQIFKVSPAQARNAYSVVLLLPGVGGGLRFHPLLAPYKRAQNSSNEKYAGFFDPWTLLLHLAQISIEVLKEDTPRLRLQFIPCSRFLCLFRSKT